MSLAFNSNINYTGKFPNFERDQFETISQMAKYSINYLPDTFIATCVEDGNVWLFNKKNSDDPKTGRWRVLGSANLKDEIIASIKVGGIDVNTTYDAGTSFEKIVTDLLGGASPTANALYYGVSNDRSISSVADLSPASIFAEVTVSVQPNNQYVIIAVPNDVAVVAIYDENGLNNTGCFQTYPLNDYTVYVSETKITCMTPFKYKIAF